MADNTVTRFGFGEKTGETEKGGLDQYEDGHVDVSGRALKHAISEYPNQPPKEAIGALLLGVNMADLEDNGDSLDYENLHESLQEIEGVGEETADEVLEAVQESVSGGSN